MWKQVQKCRRKLLWCVVLITVSMVILVNITRKCSLRANLAWVKYQIFGKKRLSTEMMIKIHENVTIITAFWDLGSFRKGNGSLEYSAYDYRDWSSVFTWMVNPLVVYTDSLNFKIIMEKYRESYPNKTKIIFTERQKFWSFQIVNNISSVFEQPDYPKFYPNTVLPEYSACQHTKYAVVADALKMDIFQTEFYAWLDIGYFRDVVCDENYFRINPPPKIDKGRLSVTKVNEFRSNISIESIFKENEVWVGGGMLVATKNVFLKFEKLYKRSVEFFLNLKIMNSDQQIIYGLYSSEGREYLKPDVELQVFSLVDSQRVDTDNVWFYLGYVCLEYV
ncbi:uncharacterized protein LOC133178900 [Saccostrea echinata]|uniref:uncharacterized protein LOC133178900 n=1 Tax=Saccostrea echinata TaxID=191078 RepID=UPI002A837AD3|nr:uncharacterized protein LOC133178900 [Saccostrea echinata]